MGSGHVGWAFDAAIGDVNCGSVENPLGGPSCPPATMGFWDTNVADPVPEFVQRAYVDIKYVDLDSVDVAEAVSTVGWVKEQPYSVIGRNCLDDVYDVLRAYGVRDLPPPSHDWLPNEWFGMWYGSGSSVRLTSFTWANRPDAHIEQMSTFFQALAKPLKEIPAEPKWRTPGTPEWHDLQSQLAAASSREPYRRHATRTI